MITRDTDTIASLIEAVSQYEYSPVYLSDDGHFVHVEWYYVKDRFPLDFLVDSPDKYNLLVSVLIERLTERGIGIVEWREPTISSVMPAIGWVEGINLKSREVPSDNIRGGFDRLAVVLRTWLDVAAAKDWPSSKRVTYEVIASNFVFPKGNVLHTTNSYRDACNVAQQTAEKYATSFEADYIPYADDAYEVTTKPPMAIHVREIHEK